MCLVYGWKIHHGIVDAVDHVGKQNRADRTDDFYNLAVVKACRQEAGYRLFRQRTAG